MIKEFREILRGFRRVVELLEKQERLTLGVATILMVITGLLTNLPAVILGKLVDTLTIDLTFSRAVPFISTIIIVILIREAITVLRKYLVENIATQTEKKQTVRVVKHLLMADIQELRKERVGSLHGKIFRSIQGLIRLIKLGFLEFFPVFFSAVAAITIAFWQKPFIATIMILVIPVGLLIIITQISSQKGIRVSLIKGKEKIDGAVVEMLGGIETVRVLNTIAYETEKVETISEALRIKEIRHHIAMALFDAVKYLNEGFFYILVIGISIFLSAQGVISKGDILVYSVLFLSITGPLREIHRILDQAHESSIHVNNLYELIHQPEDISFTPTAEKTLGDREFAVVVKDLSYGILKHISLSIKTGEKIGIAGPSGCGKSTFVKIILRLFHNYAGSVSLFGKDLPSISRTEIAQKVAYVPQQPYVFLGSIKENILYGNTQSVTEEELLEALKKASMYGEVMNSLGGLSGRVGENGNNLSGGQRQRLVLARLLIQSPDIIIFDEATSALDTKNEERIQESIEKLFADKTVITIAHRLTTLKNSDRIFVFQNGEIMQEGSYKKLATTKGLFQEFLQHKKS